MTGMEKIGWGPSLQKRVCKLSTSQQGVLAAMKVNHMLDCISNTVGSRSREIIFPFHFRGVKLCLIRDWIQGWGAHTGKWEQSNRGSLGWTTLFKGRLRGQLSFYHGDCLRGEEGRGATGLIAVSDRVTEVIEPDSSERYQGKKATTFKHCSEGDSAIQRVVKRGCDISVLWAFQNSTEQDSEQADRVSVSTALSKERLQPF